MAVASALWRAGRAQAELPQNIASGAGGDDWHAAFGANFFMNKCWRCPADRITQGLEIHLSPMGSFLTTDVEVPKEFQTIGDLDLTS